MFYEELVKKKIIRYIKQQGNFNLKSMKELEELKQIKLL